MENSANSVEKAFLPILILFQMSGIETLLNFSGMPERKLSKFLSFLTTLVFHFIFFCMLLFKSACFLFDISKNNAIDLIAMVFQTTKYLAVYQSQKNIQFLLKKLSRISYVLRSTQKVKVLKTLIILYCVSMFIFPAYFLIVGFNSKLTDIELQKFKFLTHTQKEYFSFIYSITNILTIIIWQGLFISCPSYYCFACWYIKSLFWDFQLKTQDLIKRQDHQCILEAYEELREAMKLTNKFLSFPMFLEVLLGMAKLFWFGHKFAFMPDPDYQENLYIFLGIVQSLILVSIVLLPAAAANKAAYQAWEIVTSLPAWFPQRSKEIKMYVRQKFVSNVPLTLWDIYTIDKSLFITALGTLLTYGVLIGTLGNTQNSKDEISSSNNISDNEF